MSDEALHESESALRLLPWTNPDGKPCYLSTDGTGPIARLADEMEAVQLSMAVELLGHADALLSEPRATAAELRYLTRRLCDCLRDVKRVAESRGARVPQRE
ncbi:hypothetical protein [Streptomyces sp. NPDC018693]|uniref:hypothetical protein n=1 Tax=unclassified Streptomyces TaxID=2593676 RepID=UPI00378DFF1E